MKLLYDTLPDNPNWTNLGLLGSASIYRIARRGRLTVTVVHLVGDLHVEQQVRESIQKRLPDLHICRKAIAVL